MLLLPVCPASFEIVAPSSGDAPPSQPPTTNLSLPSPHLTLPLYRAPAPAVHIKYALEEYLGDLAELTRLNKEGVVAMLRRGSSGFSRGASRYRGVTKHHQPGKWEARIGRVAGNRYLVSGAGGRGEAGGTGLHGGVRLTCTRRPSPTPVLYQGL